MGGSTRDKPTVVMDPRDSCPWALTAILPSIEDMTEGMRLTVLLEGVTPERVRLATEAGVNLGTLAGIPNLQKLIECLKDGVIYSAVVDRIEGATAFCLIKRQAG